MPNLYGQARFEQLYSNGYGSHLNTVAMFAKRAEALVSQNNGFQVSPGQSVLIVGGGFGYLAEYLINNYQFNTNNLTIIDNSPYIHLNKTTQQTNVAISNSIINIDVLASDVLTLVRGVIGGNGRSNWVITDDVISEMQNDTEINAFIANCESLQGGNGGIVHLTSTLIETATQDPSLNWKTIEQWQAYAPSHYWYDIPRDVLIGGA